MRTLDITYGKVLVELDLKRGTHWGYYELVISLDFNGNKETFRFHKTNPDVFDEFDEIEDLDERFDFLYERYENEIDACINDFCSEYFEG